jgi:hypothetical protein
LHGDGRSEEAEAHLNHADKEKATVSEDSSQSTVSKVILKIGNEIVNQTGQYQASRESWVSDDINNNARFVGQFVQFI